MIRRTDEGVAQFCARDIYGTRTAAYLATYGMDREGVSFYVQLSDDHITAVISDVYSEGTLTCTDNADFEELREFVLFLGLRTLLCSKENAERLGFPVDCEGSVMQYQHTDREPKAAYLTPDYPAFDYHKVYQLLTDCGFTPGEYNAWLGDFALRVRKGTAKVLYIPEKDEAVSTASVLFETDNAVYMGAVGTSPLARGKGYGGDLVLRLAQCGKRAEILCRPYRVSFYESLGFIRNGDFALCTFSTSNRVFLP